MAIEQSSPQKIKDGRRSILEYPFSTDCFQYFTIGSEKAPLGNHFHREKFEIFHFLEGSGTITWMELDKSGQPIGEIQKIQVVCPLTIKIPAFHAHRFDLT